MTGIRLKYVHQWVDKRSGGARPRYYFRRPGFKRLPLPGLPGSAEFMEAYQAALAGQALPRPMIGASRTKVGSIAALGSWNTANAIKLSSAGFLVDAESNLGAALQLMPGMDMGPTSGSKSGGAAVPAQPAPVAPRPSAPADGMKDMPGRAPTAPPAPTAGHTGHTGH